MSSAYIYVRVSTAEQVDNYSLDTQERAARDYCESHGLSVAGVFREEGESAKTANRPQLQAMLNACATEGRRFGVSTIVVFRVDRLSRSVEDYAAITGALQRLGIKVRSVGETFDDSPAGRLVENLMAAVAQFDNDARSARTKEGMKEAVKRGRWVWRPPLGFQVAPLELPMSLVSDPEVAPLLRHGFEAVATRGLSKAEALRELTDLGLRTRKGKPLSAQTFGSILRNPIYTGRIVKPDWGIDVAGDFEGFVEPELFAAAQDVLDGRGHRGGSRSWDNPDFPLRRLVRCGVCSGPLTASWSKGRSRTYGYYRCHRNGCKGASVRKEVLERLAVELLAGMSLGPPIVGLLDAVVRDAWNERAQISDETEAHLAIQLDDVLAKQDALVDAYLTSSVVDEVTYERQSQRLRRDEIELRNRLDAATPIRLNLTRALDTAQAMLADLAECWNQLEPTHRADFFAAIYPAGVTYAAGEIGTLEKPWWLDASEAYSDQDDALVPRTGFEPVLPA